MQNKTITVYVYAHWQGMEEAFLMGQLYSQQVRGKEVFSFEYTREWLQKGYPEQLDPYLKMYSGLHFPQEKQPNFGIFLDSSPDRWGRLLMRRKEAAIARKENTVEKQLFETDYLLGVYDESRMGAIRFKLEKDGSFLNDSQDMAIPPWTSLRELEQISWQLENEDVIEDPNYLKWLNVLMAPGSSLGGARPKASIVDQFHALWIAKFPSQKDTDNTGAWEMVTYELAIACGVNMSESKAQKFSSNYHTFLTKRFDRTRYGKRLHFASAMTMLGYLDGQDYNDGISYLDLVDFLQSNGANVEQDLQELWRRIVFYICVSNTDDHLRNHGFILTNNGWILSPGYDINPNAEGRGLKLNISENDNALDLELALQVGEFFRLSEKQMIAIVNQVTSTVKKWKKIAIKYGIPKQEQELKTAAFKQAESWR